MRLTVTTWNVNSVRLRIDLVAKFIKAARPDLLCLQETKCPNEYFPSHRFKRLGYEHIALNGQKGYHGVAVISRFPFDKTSLKHYCGKTDSRHVGVVLGEKAGLRDPLVLHNYYVPAGGDEPDPKTNEKFAHKLAFLDELAVHAFSRDARNGARSILVGDLNVAPLEHDVWSHKQLLDVVSHTPIEVEKFRVFQEAGGWSDVMRAFVPASEKLYTWWSYRAADWEASDRGRRLDHVWASPALRDAALEISVIRTARGWKQPSDHVPVIAAFDF